MMTKICKTCGIDLLVARFLPSPHFADGYTPTCRECVFARARQDRENRERRRSEIQPSAQG
jgi:hypothetical protein